MKNTSFYINIQIEGLDDGIYEITISHPELDVKEQIRRLLDTFELQSKNKYILARNLRAVCGHELIEILDESKYDKTFSELGIHSGDTLYLLLNKDKEDVEKTEDTDEKAYNKIRKKDFRFLLYM